MEEMRWPEGLKRTKQREDVFEVLSEATRPMNAFDILHAIEEKEGKCNYAVSTIYRSLTVFEEKGYVEKSILPGEDMAVYEWTKGIHRHFAICLNCHKLVELKACPFERVHITKKPQDDFVVTGHKLELYGYCKECSENLE